MEVTSGAAQEGRIPKKGARRQLQCVEVCGWASFQRATAGTVAPHRHGAFELGRVLVDQHGLLRALRPQVRGHLRAQLVQRLELCQPLALRSLVVSPDLFIKKSTARGEMGRDAGG